LGKSTCGNRPIDRDTDRDTTNAVQHRNDDRYLEPPDHRDVIGALCEQATDENYRLTFTPIQQRRN
jgi:hypothetical protein